MISQDSLAALAGGYGMVPMQFALGLPQTGMSIIRWRRTRGDSNQVLTRDPMDHYALSLHLQPTRADAWLGKKQVWSGPIAANTIRLTLPGAEPRWVSDAPFDFLHLIFPRKTIDRIAGADSNRVHRCLRDFHPLYCRDDIAASLGRSLLQALRERRPYAANFADAVGYALIAHLLGHYTGTAATAAQNELSMDLLQQARDYIAAHLSGDIRVRDLAAAAGMSESHFAHRFRTVAGVSPHRFVTITRLNHAEARLRCGSGSLLEIALDCGFNDASHFSRACKRFLGCAPNALRRKIAGRNDCR